MDRKRIADRLDASPETLRVWGLAGIVVWVVVGAGIVAWGAGHVLSALLGSLTAFLLAGLIVVLTRPFVRFMVKRGLGRPWAAAIGTLCALAVLVALVMFFGGPIVSGAVAFLESLATQGSTVSTNMSQAVASFNALPDSIKTGIENAMKAVGTAVVEAAQQLLKALFGSVTMILSMGFSLFMGLILTFWFLMDGPRISGHMLNVVPARWREDAREVAAAFNASFSGYLIGTAINASVLFLICGIGFQAIGLPYGWFLASLIGILDVIPFVGPIAAGVIAVVVGFTVNPTTALLALVVVIVGEQFTDSFLSPIVMGKAVQIHPVAIIFALSIGVMVGGFLGAILAIPAAAAIKTVYLYFRDVRPARLAEREGAGISPEPANAEA
jgi:predicted PurR-regulated permease PerM